ncbi:MAG TPA: tyrosine--tRNA ligase, partial [Candidatus Accumulibacter sp.]|nr:tyrosine--tRNA ligase [Accumulibacter sp.]HCN69511.1 tyrosine--tRNA ligase [Accumulibacter sp.]HCV13865.1 tyrosine--tRNA ligase [Accumulibacter sp.]
SFRSSEAIAALQQEVVGGRNPRDVKVLLAGEIVDRFHGATTAARALADFDARFRHGAIPDDIAEVSLQHGAEPLTISQVLKQAGLTASTSEAMRMIEQGGVRMDGNRVDDKHFVFPAAGTFVLQVGKRRHARIRVG